MGVLLEKNVPSWTELGGSVKILRTLVFQTGTLAVLQRKHYCRPLDTVVVVSFRAIPTGSFIVNEAPPVG